MTGRDISRLDAAIEGYRENMISFLSELVSVPAMAPESGGTGEMAKAEKVLEMVSGWGFGEVRGFHAPDDRVPGGLRPNFLLSIEGQDPSLPAIWIFSHIDVVPPGDLSKWSGDPYTLRVDGDKLIGRGVEDNGQGMVASLFAAKALLDAGIRPRRSVKLFLVADEEVGSAKGMVHLVREHMDIFGKDDLFLVPDAGEPDGGMIEVSEKSIMWLRISTFGKQVHASVPAKGINANLAAMRFVVSLYDDLRERYPSRDDLFDHPISSFEPTRRDANVPNVNTVPGEDVQYIDCRVLPIYDPFEVLEHIKARAADFARTNGVGMEIATVQMERAAPPTSPDHPLVGMLAQAVKEVYGADARAVGIGGGTCAAILRRAGLPSVVWARIEETAHMPDETALLSNYIGDAKVFMRLFMT